MAKLTTPPRPAPRPRPDVADANKDRAADRVVARISKPRPPK
jgi:hypothetical protein